MTRLSCCGRWRRLDAPAHWSAHGGLQRLEAEVEARKVLLTAFRKRGKLLDFLLGERSCFKGC